MNSPKNVNYSTCVPNNVKFHLFCLSEFQLLMGPFAKSCQLEKIIRIKIEIFKILFV